MDSVTQGRRSIRRSRAFLLVSVVAFVASLAVSDPSKSTVLFLAPVPIAAVMLIAWYAFAFRPCPRCGDPFFVAGDGSKNPLRLRFALNPFRTTCASCDLPLAEGHAG